MAIRCRSPDVFSADLQNRSTSMPDPILPMAQTYIAWRRHTLLAAIDALPGAAGPEAAASFENLLRHLNHSLPTQEITATLDDLIKAQPHLCTARQLEAMRAFRDHLAVAV
jgi:hypothetical protein